LREIRFLFSNYRVDGDNVRMQDATILPDHSRETPVSITSPGVAPGISVVHKSGYGYGARTK